MEFKEFYTLKQLSKELSISIQTLRKEVKAGNLIVSKVGTRYIAQREDIKQWLDDQTLTKEKLQETQAKHKADQMKRRTND